jgi:hypothetical protein
MKKIKIMRIIGAIAEAAKKGVAANSLCSPLSAGFIRTFNQ